MDLEEFKRNFQTRKVELQKILKEIDEPIITLNEGINNAYRFFWMRRLHQSSIIISLYTKIHDGKLVGGELIFKEIAKSWWSKPFQVEKRIERQILESEIKLLENHLEEMNFWNFPEVDSRIGLDGSDWIFEAKNRDKYHIARRWSPVHEETLKDFSSCGIYLLQLSGIDLNDRKYSPFI